MTPARSATNRPVDWYVRQRCRRDGSTHETWPERPTCRREDSPRPRRCRPVAVVAVRSKDGTRLHAEVFGPEDGYPIVLAHGITCAIRVWAYQIADLANDYRVIAFDHRGHGRSGVPARRSDYSLDHLAADLDAVLEATLAAGRTRGHRRAFDGRHRHHVLGRALSRAGAAARRRRRADQHHHRRPAAHVQFLPVPPPLADARVRAGGTLLKTFGAAPLLRAVDRPSRRFVSTMAVGRDADPAIAEFVYELFTATPPAGRGGWARALVDSLGPAAHRAEEPDRADAGDRQREGPAAADGLVAPHRRRWRRTWRSSSSCPAATARSSSAPTRSTSSCACSIESVSRSERRGAAMSPA